MVLRFIDVAHDFEHSKKVYEVRAELLRLRQNVGPQNQDETRARLTELKNTCLELDDRQTVVEFVETAQVLEQTQDSSKDFKDDFLTETYNKLT